MGCQAVGLGKGRPPPWQRPSRRPRSDRKEDMEGQQEANPGRRPRPLGPPPDCPHPILQGWPQPRSGAARGSLQRRRQRTPPEAGDADFTGRGFRGDADAECDRGHPASWLCHRGSTPGLCWHPRPMQGQSREPGCQHWRGQAWAGEEGVAAAALRSSRKPGAEVRVQEPLSERGLGVKERRYIWSLGRRLAVERRVHPLFLLYQQKLTPCASHGIALVSV